MLNRSLIEIDLSAVRHNLRTLDRLVGPACGICPILKADAYGFGAPRVARVAAEAGARMAAVYAMDQAAEILPAAGSCPVLVLMPVRRIAADPTIDAAVASGRLHLTVHGRDHLADLVSLAVRRPVPLPVHVEVNTGMSRGGCDLDEITGVLECIAGEPRLRLAGLMTHFARARNDAAFTTRQIDEFEAVVARVDGLLPDDCVIHAANTFGTLRQARAHQRMVRTGLAWCGYGPEWLQPDEMVEPGLDFRPALSWMSRIVHVREIEAGTAVGYGSSWTARRRSVIGLAAVGYADGYPTELGATDGRPTAGQVRVTPDPRTGRAPGFCPVVGAVNMDQITIDLTDLDCPSATLVDAPVELIGTTAGCPTHMPELARLSGRLPHELLCRLNPRIRRTYSDADGPEVGPDPGEVTVASRDHARVHSRATAGR